MQRSDNIIDREMPSTDFVGAYCLKSHTFYYL